MTTKSASELANEELLPYLLTAEQVCEVFQISRMTLWRLEQKEKIKAVRLGTQTKRYSIPALEEFVRNNKA
jgi:excisionase family DNA binding protein